nr:enoyl-CoA hydratase/isomerase family protein [Pseudaminobacter sp.]
MGTFAIKKLAMLLAATAALHSTQILAQTAKPSGNTDTEVRAVEDNQTARIRLTRKSAAYWAVTFNNPPLNIIGPAEVRELAKIVDRIEADPEIKVIVFDSAVPGYF